MTSSAKSAAGDVQGAGQSAGRQVDQATPDLSANPFDDLLGKVVPETPMKISAYCLTSLISLAVKLALQLVHNKEEISHFMLSVQSGLILSGS